ncbi:hypothetical protein ACHAPU_000128 [Fusarium lateritium]
MSQSVNEAALAAKALLAAYNIQQAYQTRAQTDISDEEAQIQEIAHVLEILRTLPQAIAAAIFPQDDIDPELLSQYWGKAIPVVFDGRHIILVTQGVLIKRPQLLKAYVKGTIQVPGLDQREAHILIRYLYEGTWEPLAPIQASKLDQLKSAIIEAVSIFDASIHHDLRGLGRLACIEFTRLADQLGVMAVLKHFATYAYAGLHSEFMIAEYAYKHTHIAKLGTKSCHKLFTNREKFGHTHVPMAKIILTLIENNAVKLEDIEEDIEEESEPAVGGGPSVKQEEA